MQQRATRRGVVAASAATVAALLLAGLVGSGPAVASRGSQGGEGVSLRVSASQAAAPDSWHAAGRTDQRRSGRVFGGLRETARCAGGFEVEDSRGACSHGPDPAPPGVDVREVPTAAELAADAGSGDGTAAAAGSVPCYGDGSTGKRVQAIYAVSSDLVDRYASVVGLIRGYAWNADQAFYNSAVRDGGVRHLRWVTDAGCQLLVDHVVLSPTGDDSISNTLTELRNLGYTRNDRKYVVFADAAVYCGISYVAGDARADATNPANSGATVSRIDSACWGGSTSVPAHEIAHALGAVQLTAPHSNGAWHCTDEYDRLCYNDGSGATLTYLCASSQEPLLDCNGDDYFNVAPVAGSWLATHWNLANSAFLETVEPSSGTSTATPTTPAPTTPAPDRPRPPTPPAPTVGPTLNPVVGPPTVAPTPTVTATTTPTASPTKRTNRRARTVWKGRLALGERADTYRFRAGKGRLVTSATLVKGSKIKIRVLDRKGRVVLRKTGRAALSALVSVRAGTYRLKVTAPVGTRYRVTVVRASR